MLHVMPFRCAVVLFFKLVLIVFCVFQYTATINPTVRWYCIVQIIILLNLAIYQVVSTRKGDAALKSRDEFIAVASHELKTPLTSLMMQMHLLKNIQNDPAKQKEVIDQATSSMERMKKLIETLLDLTKIKTRHLVMATVQGDIMEIIHGVRKQYSYPIRVHGPPSLIMKSDHERIRQVMDNLISNGVKYGAGEPIEVCVTQMESHVFISVKDRGIGISKKDQKRIFETFERAVDVKDGIPGTGIGLFVVKDIVEAHGGKIFVKSEKDKGSVFTVKLPIA